MLILTLLGYDSNPLQKIIEQRKLESSTDSEESEEELDDDYDIGIDDIELDTEENEEDHEVCLLEYYYNNMHCFFLYFAL